MLDLALDSNDCNKKKHLWEKGKESGISTGRGFLALKSIHSPQITHYTKRFTILYCAEAIRLWLGLGLHPIQSYCSSLMD